MKRLKTMSMISVDLGSTYPMRQNTTKQPPPPGLWLHCNPGRGGSADIPSTFFPSTVTVDSTTEIVASATSTVTVTVSEMNYALTRRSHVRKDQIQERAAMPRVTPRAALPPSMVLKARQEAEEGEEEFDLAALGEALSSACSCKMVEPLTTYLVSTAPAVVSANGNNRCQKADENRRGPLEPPTIRQSLSTTLSLVA